MRLRFPGLGELVALFVADNSVAGAITGLRRSQARLAKLVALQKAKADQAAKAQADYLREADRLAQDAINANNEAEHARRVYQRLEGLCA